MTQDSIEKRNFLFFLNDVYPLSFVDSLSGALANPSSWDDVAGMVNTARQKDSFVRSINKVYLYIHVPFCGRLCTFCHCARVLLRRRLEIDDYIKALMRQMMFFAPVYEGMDAGTVCFGGGTPSILNVEQMTAILNGVDKVFPAPNRKILFEISPASWTASKLNLLSSRGLCRLSIGVQSLDGNVLKQVSRSQTRQKALWCLRSARKAGISHVNVDLIAGLPGQTIRGLIEDLKFVIDEGANIIHVQPYAGLSWKELCGHGETIPEFFNRRHTMMIASTEILEKAGFHHTGHEGTYTCNGEEEYHYQEEAYTRLEAAVAAFGPFAKGQVPGAVYYRMGVSRPTTDYTSVVACAQDFGYAMSHYAVIAVIKGLDEQVFLQRFGVSLDQHCGEGLRYLQQSGLVTFSKGIWKFSGKWDVLRIHEYFALSRVLFGEDLLLRLRDRFFAKYDPCHDYSKGNSLLKAYSNSCVMTLYYQMGLK